jgi:hypothetical protein
MKITRNLTRGAVLGWGLAILLTFLSSTPAVAQESPTEDPFVFVLACQGLPHNGAGTVDVQLDQEGNAFLRGLVGDKVIWRKKIPLPDTVNTPKTTVACDGANITFSSQFPGSTFTHVYTVNWNGDTFSLTANTTRDPSAEAVEKIIRLAETGDREGYENAIENETGDIFYPQNYINGNVLAAALARGQKAAAALGKAGKPKEAADRLALMFDATVFLGNRIAGGGDSPEDTPGRWLNLWSAMKIPVKNYIGPFNDYGFYLQQSKEHGAAIPIFKEVLRLSPGRIVTYLNLADSQWEFGFFDEARANYQKYQALMFDRGKTKAVPVRVIQRLGKG